MIGPKPLIHGLPVCEFTPVEREGARWEFDEQGQPLALHVDLTQAEWDDSETRLAFQFAATLVQAQTGVPILPNVK